MNPARRHWIALSIAALLSLHVHAAEAAGGTVDLHAHLYMKTALRWFFRGDFDEPLVADSWDDRLSSKINADSLNASGNDIVVVSLIAHPIYRSDMRQSVREQIALAERFVARHDGWAIARSAEQARAIIAAGRRALVLSLEGASGVLESEEDLREFIDERGIRIVTEIHLVDDRFGGAAVLSGYQYFANPSGVIDQLLDAHADAEGIEVNRLGLTPLGKRLAVELVARGVWIDLTHASDRTLAELVPIVEAADQPLLFTHTSLRSERPTERALSEAMLKRVARSGGLVGLLPSEDAIEQAHDTARFCPEGCSAAQCSASIHAFAAMYTRVARAIGPDAVMLGSDHNGGMRHLRPACRTHSELDAEAGLYHIGQTPTLWRELRELGAPVPPAGAQVQRFIDTWARVHPADVAAAIDPDGALPLLPSRDEVEGPSIALALGAGVSGGHTRFGDIAVVASADVYLRKDHAADIAVEPIVYFAHASGELHLTPGRGRALPFAEARFAPVGIVTHAYDNVGLAEALRIQLRRNDALAQDAVLEAALLRGVVRTMPGLLKRPGHYNLFVELDADLLGYKYLHHRAAGATAAGRTHRWGDLHAVYIAGGALLLGATAHPGEALRISLYGGIGADFSWVTSWSTSAAYQSDIDARAGFELGDTDRAFTHFFEAHYLASREVAADDARWLTTPLLRGGINVRF